MDPSVRKLLGIKQIETGDYKWRDSMRPELSSAIAKRLDKWVTKKPPYCYDPKKASDMDLWKTRHKSAMIWVKSDEAINFGKQMYNVYSTIFSSLIKDKGNIFYYCVQHATDMHDHAGQTQFVKVLENFFAEKRVHEEGELRERLQELLKPYCPILQCDPSDVVDCLSFVLKNFQRPVFDFFGSKVRKTHNSKPATKRKKDREDEVSVSNPNPNPNPNPNLLSVTLQHRQKRFTLPV